MEQVPNENLEKEYLSQDAVILELFDKLVGKGGFHPDRSYLIRSDGIPENILVLLKLLAHYCTSQDASPHPARLALIILNNSFCMFYKSTRNHYILLKTHLDVLGTLIDSLPSIQNEKLFEKTLLLIELLGRFSINVKQLKNYFSLMSDISIPEDKKILLLQALQNITEKAGPKCFFDFDGVNSAIQLPAMDKWPSSHYSISMWICIESHDSPSGSPYHEPRLFSFMTSKGTGLEVYFARKRLYVRTNQTNKAALKFNFETQKWYHVVIMHQYSKMEWLSLGNSSLKLFVNGKLEEETTLKYPDVSEQLVICNIGASKSIENAFVHIPKETSFYGQMGMFILFSVGLSPSQVLELYHLGYNYVPNFYDKDLLTRHGAPNMIISQSPRTTEGRLCKNLTQLQQSLDNNFANVVNLLPIPLPSKKTFSSSSGSADNSPAVSPKNKEHANIHGFLAGECEVITVSDIKDTLYGAMGIQALLPLFHYIQSTQTLLASTLNALLVLMSDFLTGHASNQNEMKDFQIFSVLGFLLQKVSQNMDTLTVSAVSKLISSVSSSETLLQDSYRHLLLNFDIWVTTSFPIQQELTQRLLKNIQQRPQLFRHTFGVQNFLDILRNYYWLSEETVPTEQVKLFSKGARVISEAQIKQIRQNLLVCIETLITESVEYAEVQAMVYFLQDCTDSEQLLDGLKLMFNLLSSKPPLKFLLNHLETLGGIKVFFGGVSRNEMVCSMTFKVIGKYLQLQPPKQKTRLLGEYAAAFTSLAELANDCSMTFYTFCCLIEILIEDITLEMDPTHSKLLIADSAKLVNPQVLPPLFKLIESSPFELQMKILQEFIQICTQNAEFANAFLEQSGWQAWLLSLVLPKPIYETATVSVERSTPTPTPPASPGPGIPFGRSLLNRSFDGLSASGAPTPSKIEKQPSLEIHLVPSIAVNEAEVESVASRDEPEAQRNEDSQEISEAKLAIKDLVLRFFTVLLHHKFLAKDGWKALEETETYLLNFSRNGSFDDETREFSTRLFTSFLKSIEGDIIKSDLTKVNFWKNYTNFIALMDEFLFVPIMHRTPDGTWSDLDFALKLLDAFDFSLRPPNNDHLSGIDLSSAKGKDIFAIILKITLYTFLESYSRFSRNQQNGENSEEVSKSESPMNSPRKNTSPMNSPRKSDSPMNSPRKSDSAAARSNAELKQLFSKNVERVRHLLLKVLTLPGTGANSAKDAEENGKKVAWVFYYLLKTILKSLKMNDSSRDFVVLFAKEILRGNVESLKLILTSQFEAPQENATIEELVQYYEKLNWNFDVLEKIDKNKDTIEGADTNLYFPQINARRERNTSLMRQKMKKDSQTDLTNKKRVTSECFALNQKQRTLESERRSDMVMLHSDNLRSVSGRWKKMWRTLTCDRSCWSSLDKAFKIYWKLDSTENSLRMRPKLKRNYYGTDHKEASLSFRKQGSRIGLAEEAAALEKQHLEASKDDIEREVTISDDDQEEREENLLKALSSMNAVKQESDIMEDFEKEMFDDLEESWCLVSMADYSEDKDKTRISEKILFSTPCEMVTPLQKIEGRLIITASNLHFLATQQATTRKKDKCWALSNIADVQKRRFLLRNNALEIFLLDSHKSYLFNFSTHVNKKVLQALSKVCPNPIEGHNLSPSQLLKNSGLTQKWMKREITNFEYLMRLNTLAGRTYNDLTQYPVFPWILMDYESPVLDLANPEIYRDLSKPVGALSAVRLRRFIERFEAFEGEPSIPKFLYGSHYSSIGSVLYYLIRLEPFTTQFLENLQGGKFDVADRMFHSVATTHKNCLTSPSDVKELVPEFFYNAEFLRNSNEFDLGVKQDGIRLDNVILPPWAATPEDFVRINREALESEFVSNNLHEWIDLIFGFKQKGKAAEKANNLFYYLTYEGSVDLDAISDVVERDAMESQIANFGQTPSQLLFHPHPKREPANPAKSSPFSHPGLLKAHTLHTLSFSPSSLYVGPNELAIFSSGGDVSSHYIDVNKAPATGMSSYVGGSAAVPSVPCTFMEHNQANFPLVIQEFMVAPFVILPECGNAMLVCSKWDNSFRLIENSKVTQLMTQHTDAITCFGVDAPDQNRENMSTYIYGYGHTQASTYGGTRFNPSTIVVTGSKDTTLCVWSCQRASGKGKGIKFAKKPKHILRGHDDEVTCVCASVDFDICVSGSKDTTVIIHTLEYGRYVRTIQHPNRCAVQQLAISPQNGDIVIYSTGDSMLHLFSLNGRLLRSKSVADDIVSHMIVSKERDLLFTAGRRVVMRQVWNLEILHTFENLGYPSRVMCLGLSKEEQHIFAALENGKVVVIAKTD